MNQSNNEKSNDNLSGTVERFLFKNGENGFTVLILQTSSGTQVTVKGYLPSIQAGQEVHLKGNWVFHSKFGKQFDAQYCETSLPVNIVGLKKYLSSGMIKGIGKVYAEKLVNHFGVNILDIINTSPEKLNEVAGIGPKRIGMIITAWKDQKEIANIMVFLQDKGISSSFATKIYKQYKHESIAVLQENPYRLCDEIWGIGFKTADEIAKKLGISNENIQRIKAGLVYTISTATNQGHLYIELNELKEKTKILLELNADHDHLLKNALINLYEKETIKLITDNDVHYLTLSQFYYSEIGTSNKLKNLLKFKSDHYLNIDEIYNELRSSNNDQINLNEKQQLGIIAALTNKVTVITGGPGTGKTTLIKNLLAVLDKNRISYKLAAPTGRAAKRIYEGTHKNATTLHRLLEFDPHGRGFKHNEKNALKLDYLIVDEASMIDIFLAHAILKAMPQHAHLILIGDIDQLPSVGAGNFLNDIIESEKVACVRLTEIFRQAQDSLIVVNAHKINKGEFPTQFMPDSKKDFLFIKEEKAENIDAHLKKIFKEVLPRYFINSSDAIVLTPMNRSIVGTHSLNYMLQNYLNPENIENSKITISGTTFKINDRVMQIRNNYDKFVFNGDIGIIESIDLTDKVLTVNFQEKIIEYEFDELSELVLAYSISIHKSQGSEYPAVIIPIFMQHFMLLQRNLIYTGLTRAKKLCIFIGQSKALAIAIRNTKGTKRITFLKKFLTTDDEQQPN